MKYLRRKKKELQECDGCIDGVISSVGYGMGNAVPCQSGDTWGNAIVSPAKRNPKRKRLKVHGRK